MDVATFIKFKVHKVTGERTAIDRIEMRPPSGTKELARRRKANKAAKQARKRNR